MRVIENWESQDEPEHLRTIRDRILSNEQRAGFLLELYQQIWDAGEVAANNSEEEARLKLSGIVVKQGGKLRAYNRIYREVFNRSWIERELGNLRPYSEAFRAWVASGERDESRLLRGGALQEAQAWAKGKNLSYLDQQFLAACEKKAIEEQIAVADQQAQLERERKDREAAEKRNQALAEANRKAKRQMLIGSVVLVSTLVVAIVSGIVAERQAAKAREGVKQAQQAQREAEGRASTTIQQAEQRVQSAEVRLQKVNADARLRVQQANQQVAVAVEQQQKAQQDAQIANQKSNDAKQRVALAVEQQQKAQQDAQAANQQAKDAKQRVQQANQQVALAEAKQQKAQQDAQVANQKVKEAQQRIQQANQEVASAMIGLDQARQEIQNVSLLSALGGQLYRSRKNSEAEQAWKQAALSLEIPDYNLKQAMLLSNISIAYQQLGELSEANNSVSESLNLLQAYTDKKISPDNSAILSFALSTKGRLLLAQGDIQGALSAHTKAFDRLQSLSNDLTRISPALQVSFSKTVENVYRGLIGSLLQSKDTGSNQQNLEKARQVIESLQLTELNNFRQIASLNTNLVKIDQIDAKAAVIYPVILDDRLEVILHLPGQPLHRYSISSSAREVESTITELRELIIRPWRKNDREKLSQKVYEWLIKPAEAELAKSEVKTLVFVLDGVLRNIPMAALHDSQQYLVEKYAIALTPGLQTIELQPHVQRPLRAVVAGISEARSGFGSLPYVEYEVKQITSMIPNSELLLNSHFTSEALKNAINSFSFPIVHIATYSQFSSNSEKTFILAWDNKITAKDFEELLDFRKQGKSNPIELLVLSAPQTAIGDEQAVFGLTGSALKFGVRSTLASLWSVDDQGTAVLISQFYREIAHTAVNKAEALRQAQLFLLQDSRYRHTRYWAPFILVGDWR